MRWEAASTSWQCRAGSVHHVQPCSVQHRLDVVPWVWWWDLGRYLPSGSSMVGNSIVSNTASITGGLGSGGGIGMSSSEYALVDGNVIERNVAQGGPAPTWGSRGGGFYAAVMQRSDRDEQTSCSYNTASVPANGQGGGAYLGGCDDAKVASNLLQGNVACASTTSARRGPRRRFQRLRFAARRHQCQPRAEQHRQPRTT